MSEAGGSAQQQRRTAESPRCTNCVSLVSAFLLLLFLQRLICGGTSGPDVVGSKAANQATPQQQQQQVFAPENMSLIILSVFIVLLAEFGKGLISPFYARKMVHLTCGMLILSVKKDLFTRIFMFLFAGGLAVFNWMSSRSLRFTKRKDFGIQAYAYAVLFWLIFDLPFAQLAPLFLADPLGAITGRLLGSTLILPRKSIAGSVTVFFVTLLCCVGYIPTYAWRISFSLVVTLAEFFGGSYDNATMSLTCFANYVLLRRAGFL